jgi:hypothetical protein
MNENKKMVSFINLRRVEPMMDWNDIKLGETYHLPPLVYNKRMDFVVVEKKEDSMKIRKIGDEYPQTMFRTDITTRFVVKKQVLHGSN